MYAPTEARFMPTNEEMYRRMRNMVNERYRMTTEITRLTNLVVSMEGRERELVRQQQAALQIIQELARQNRILLETLDSLRPPPPADLEVADEMLADHEVVIGEEEQA